MSARNHHQFVFPDDSRWDDARQAWNLAADLRPAVVVLPTSVDEVVDAVEYAVRARPEDRRPGHRSRRLRARARSTGRSCSTCARCARSRSTPRTAARGSRPARCGKRSSGRRPSTASRRCTARRPNVGVVGYSLGGGIGWLARKHGLSADSVLAVELVTADGTLVRADRTQNTDLFWALRGGGGGLGVVVAMEIALYEVDELVAGHDDLAVGAVGGGAHALRRVGGDGARTRSARRPGCCRSRRCRTSRSSSAAARSSSSTAPCSAARRRRTRSSPPFRELEPEIDTFGPCRPAALIRLHMDPEPPMPGHRRRCHGRRPRRRRGRRDRRDGRARHRLAARSWSSCASSAGRCASGSRVRARSGRSTARSRSSPSASRWARASAEAIERRIEALKAALAPWSRGKPYLNFAEKRVTIGDAIGARGVRAARAGEGVGRSRRPLPLGAHVRSGDGRPAARRRSPRRAGPRIRGRSVRRRGCLPGRRGGTLLPFGGEIDRADYHLGDSFRLI